MDLYYWPGYGSVYFYLDPDLFHPHQLTESSHGSLFDHWNFLIPIGREGCGKYEYTVIKKQFNIVKVIFHEKVSQEFDMSMKVD